MIDFYIIAHEPSDHSEDIFRSKMILVSLVIAVAAVGLVESGESQRIFNGDRVERAQRYPWLVRIDAGKKHSCGGTLIDRQWVLTSGACLDKLKRFTIYVRDYNRKREDGEQVFTARKVVIHPYFNMRTMKYDLAMIKLSRPVLGLASPAIGKLSTDKIDTRIFLNDNRCITAGWGEDRVKTARWRASTYPQQTEVKLVMDNKCKAAPNFVGKVMQGCVEAKSVAGACKKDSGGPLQCWLNKQWVLLGVYSYSVGTAPPSVPCKGGNMVMTKVSPFREWIEEVIEEKETGFMDRYRARKYKLTFDFWDADKDGYLTQDHELNLVADFVSRANNTEKTGKMLRCWAVRFMGEQKLTVEDFMEKPERDFGLTQDDINDLSDDCTHAEYTTVDDNADGYISLQEYYAYTCLFNHCDRGKVATVFDFYNPVHGKAMKLTVIRKWDSFVKAGTERKVDGRYIEAMYAMIDAD